MGGAGEAPVVYKAKGVTPVLDQAGPATSSFEVGQLKCRVGLRVGNWKQPSGRSAEIFFTKLTCALVHAEVGLWS